LYYITPRYLADDLANGEALKAKTKSKIMVFYAVGISLVISVFIYLARYSVSVLFTNQLDA